MNEKETYGVKITAETSDFKKKLKEISSGVKLFGERVSAFNQGVKEELKRQFDTSKNEFKEALKEFQDGVRNFGKKTQENTSISSVFNADKVGYTRQIEYIETKMDALADKIQSVKSGLSDGDLLQLRAEYEILNNKLGSLVSKQEELNNDLEETEEKGKKINLGKMFDKSISKIKRFTYYLLGARSVFSLFMKYQSIYYQYNEKMQYQTELSQNAIALSLAPAFELLGNMVAYASIGFAKFIELLTGVNVLSKVSTKGIRDYNKSLKETQTLVSGIDEITNLTTPNTLGLASQYEALADFKKKIEEVNRWFDKNPWVKKFAEGLQKVYDFITGKLIPKIDDFIEKIGGAEGALKLLGGVAVMRAIAKLIGHAGAGATAGVGLAGVAGLLTFIAGTFTITLILNATKVLNDLQEIRKELEPYGEKKFMTTTAPKTVEEQIKTLKTLTKGTKEYQTLLKDINNWWDTINGTIASGDKNYLTNLDKYKDVAKQLSSITGNKAYTEIINASKKLGDYKSVEKNKSAGQLIAGSVLNVLSLGAYNKAQQEELDKLIEEYNKSKNKLQYANGLDYVPYDNYTAILHKGETVVPAKYNPTIHSVGNDYTNSLLETMIVKLDDISKRPNEFNVDGQQLARVVYPLLQAEGRNYNYNEGVSR